LFVLLLGCLSLLACAHRPELAPAGSPASLSEPELPRMPVTRALREDPPLPGTPTDGWSGLQQRGGGKGGHRQQAPAPAQNADHP
jgi:hypothetical protein